MEKWGSKDQVELFKFKDVTETRVKEIFKQLKNTHSECMDGFSNKVIKISAPSLIRPMKHLINASFKTNIFPSKWKIFKLIGLYKNKGDNESLENYRPIALLNPFSKVLEIEIFSQMNSHMDKFKMWNKNGYAYKKHHSTIHALMDLAEVWCSNIDSNTQSVNMMLDMSCAFDLVSHDTLLEKMKIYKYDTNSIKLMKSYLSFRSQYVDICGEKSEFLWNKHGVPQGSIMGPFLFSLYVNELSAILNYECDHNEKVKWNDNIFGEDCSKCGVMVTFADDCTIILESMKHNSDITSSKLDKILNSLEIFLKENNLKLNKSKTNLIRTTTSQQLTKNGCEKIKISTLDSKNKPIVPKNAVQLLGLVIS